MLPLALSAQRPAIEALGKEAKRQKGVEYESVGSFMLGMASALADKEQAAIFKMLDNIEMILCSNDAYTPTLERKVMAIVKSVKAEFLATTSDDKSTSDVYAVRSGKSIKELIILTRGDKGGYAIVAMSGTIPENRLDEIAKLRPPKK